ncbi:MAG: hypothetical protein M1338_02140 [Patescibacteria group bacterium]|nr:hypothetical protein [Patescibacteria group bacterium]
MDIRQWMIDDPEELKDLIQKKPMTIESIIETLGNKISLIYFDDTDGKNSGIAIPVFEDKKPSGLYTIVLLDSRKFKLNNKKLKKVKIYHLFHEIAHVFYSANGNPWTKDMRSMKIENLLKKEAERFIKENKDFAEDIYDRARAGDFLEDELL